MIDISPLNKPCRLSRWNIAKVRVLLEKGKLILGKADVELCHRFDASVRVAMHWNSYIVDEAKHLNQRRYIFLNIRREEQGVSRFAHTRSAAFDIDPYTVDESSAYPMLAWNWGSRTDAR